MDEVCLFFGRPLIKDRGEFISAQKDLQAKLGCVIQALDASVVVSKRHLTFAAEKALSAFFEGRNVAKDLGVEILRYASGQRQIERALIMGISKSTKRVALMVIPKGIHPCPKAEELSGLLEIDDLGPSFDPQAVKETFGITAEEIWAAGEEKIPELVIERVALVDTYR